MSLRNLFHRSLIVSIVLTPALALGISAKAATSLVPAYTDLAPRGPHVALGVVVYSHGRSLTGEDSTSPSPAYLKYLAKAGWDVLRFDRPSSEDALDASSADLARRAARLKAEGYGRVILTGQSFGAFLSIKAAKRSGAVDGVIATAPAAFGSYSDSFESWRMNATELYADLAGLRRTRVLLAFFHGDDYDPGGRADRARALLTRDGVFAVIIDQPRDLVGHLAGAGPQFAKRFGSCLEHFADATADEDVCQQSTIIRPATNPHSPAGRNIMTSSLKTPASGTAN